MRIMGHGALDGPEDHTSSYRRGRALAEDISARHRHDSLLVEEEKKSLVCY